MFRKFASVSTDQHAYAIDSTKWEDTHVPSPKFRMFSTYGDRLIQHSGDHAVPVEFLPDFLISLAADLQKLHDGCDATARMEYAREVQYILADVPCRDALEFAASVVFKESDKLSDKTRFVSVKQRKIGSRKAKQFDSRYTELSAWMDGGMKSIYRLLISEYACGITRYAYFRKIREFWIETGRHAGYVEDVLEYLGWFQEKPRPSEPTRLLRIAYDAALSAARAHLKRVEAESGIESYKSMGEQFLEEQLVRDSKQEVAAAA
jgi:hypothetical protein